MSQTLDSHYWQEQAQRANEIHPILEQTFALAQQYGWVAPLADECWQYQGEAHTLVYDPNADVLWVEANADTWRINFHQQVFVPEAATHITEEQLQDCRDLRDYLEQQSVPDTVDLRAIQQAAQQQWQQTHQTLTAEGGSLTATAAQLFEAYAVERVWGFCLNFRNRAVAQPNAEAAGATKGEASHTTTGQETSSWCGCVL